MSNNNLHVPRWLASMLGSVLGLSVVTLIGIAGWFSNKLSASVEENSRRITQTTDQLRVQISEIRERQRAMEERQKVLMEDIQEIKDLIRRNGK